MAIVPIAGVRQPGMEMSVTRKGMGAAR
jgi:hypothetical protein